ncbi:MAG: polyprenyl synthetase family protein [Saprospiraceae bacterium]
MKNSLSDIKLLVEDYFSTQSFNQQPQGLYNPINYIMSLGGKRIRSILTLLGYMGYNDELENALPLAYSTELFHNFTLVHDDIMDAAPLRRGATTVHQKYSINAAILSGDAMHAHVVKIISRLNNPAALKIVKRFCDTSILVCQGQSDDMAFETQDEVSMTEYLKMIEMKTAVLIGYALESGALLANADDNHACHLYLFGKNAGIAFQLQDDFLDLYGESYKVGKQKCGDIIQKKKNYFFVKAFELLEEKERIDFLELYHSNINQKDRVEQVLKVYDDLYLKNYIAESKAAFMNLAFSHLDATAFQKDRLEMLKTMALTLADRPK